MYLTVIKYVLEKLLFLFIYCPGFLGIIFDFNAVYTLIIYDCMCML